MSAFDQIKSTAETAIIEIESEIFDLEERIEAHKLRIQSARVQIQALKKFLSPEENNHDAAKPAKPKKNGKVHNDTLELQ